MRLRYIVVTAALVAAAGAALYILHVRAGRDARPNVLVIVIDTLRRDHVGAYGCKRPTTGAIDRLAAENVLFTNAYANSNWTKPSVASLFTGLYVSQHGVKYIVTNMQGDTAATQRLPESAFTLAEMMNHAGYFTMGVIENVHISAKLGFAQGFTLWDERPYGATNVTNSFLGHLDEIREPFFAYVHYFDPHAPYYRTRNFETEGAITPGLQDAKSEDLRWTTYTFGVDRGISGMSFIERRRLEDLYDGEVRNVDTGIARILATLKSRGMYDNTWVIMTADHGENFGEGRRVTHPHDCFSNAQVRIPLVMKLPESERIMGRVVMDPVELVDVMPTIASYLKISPPPGAVGVDLGGAVFDGTPLPARAIVAESESGKMLVSSKYKYVEVPTELGNFRFVFDESKDPLDEHNLAEGDTDLTARLASAWASLNDEAKRRETVQASRDVQLTKEEIETMRSLGYFH